MFGMTYGIKMATLGAMALVGMNALATPAHAGTNFAFGITIGQSYPEPAPVVVYPQPATVVYPQPVVVYPQPVAVYPQPYYVAEPRYGYAHERYERHERFERGEWERRGHEFDRDNHGPARPEGEHAWRR